MLSQAEPFVKTTSKKSFFGFMQKKASPATHEPGTLHGYVSIYGEGNVQCHPTVEPTTIISRLIPSLQ